MKDDGYCGPQTVHGHPVHNMFVIGTKPANEIVTDLNSYFNSLDYFETSFISYVYNEQKAVEYASRTLFDDAAVYDLKIRYDDGTVFVRLEQRGRAKIKNRPPELRGNERYNRFLIVGTKREPVGRFVTTLLEREKFCDSDKECLRIEQRVKPGSDLTIRGMLPMLHSPLLNLCQP